MGSKQIPGYVKSENVIWVAAAALLVGFISGVAFGVYKSGTIVDPHRQTAPAAMDDQRKLEIDRLKAQTQKNPENAQAWIQLGHQYFDANLAAEAIDAYETALKIDPQNANVWTDLGVMYRRSDDPQKAVAAFDRAMKIDASHEISRFNKGLVLFHDLQDPQGALTAWTSLLAINPEAKAPNGQAIKELVDHIEAEHQANGTGQRQD